MTKSKIFIKMLPLERMATSGVLCNVPTASSQPSTDDHSIGSHSSEGAEVAKNVSLVSADYIVGGHIPSWFYQPEFSFRIETIQSDSVSLSDVKQSDVEKVSDLLEGSNRYVQKCSLNDIMFLVMLVLTKSVADQRQTRFEAMMSKKKTSADLANVIYGMRISQAEKQYKAEKTEAIIQIVSGAVSVASGIVAIAGAAAQGLSAAPLSVLRAVGSAIRAATFIIKIAMAIIKPAWMIAAAVISMKVSAKSRKESEFVSAEFERTRAFFQYTMKQIRNMQEAYNSSQKDVKNALDSMKEVIQKKYEIKSTVLRNI